MAHIELTIHISTESDLTERKAFSLIANEIRSYDPKAIIAGWPNILHAGLRNFSPAFHKAMDEFAKEECKEYGDFIIKKLMPTLNGGNATGEQKEQLYNLYLESKKQKV